MPVTSKQFQSLLVIQRKIWPGHILLQRTVCSTAAKCILILWNPKDFAVSWSHWLNPKYSLAFLSHYHGYLPKTTTFWSHLHEMAGHFCILISLTRHDAEICRRSKLRSTVDISVLIWIHGWLQTQSKPQHGWHSVFKNSLISKSVLAPYPNKMTAKRELIVFKSD